MTADRAAATPRTGPAIEVVDLVLERAGSEPPHLDRERCSRARDELDPLARKMPDPAAWSLATLCAPDAEGHHPALTQLLAQCVDAAWALSEAISLRYFTHTFETGQSLGA